MSAPRTSSAPVLPPAPPRAAAPPVHPDPPGERRPAPRRRSLRSRLGPYLLLLPALVPVAVGLGYPLVRQFVLSFQEYGLAQQFGRPAEWVGLRNYTTLLSDPYVWGVIGRSVLFCLVNAALTMAVGIAVAVLMTRVGRGARITLQVGLLLAWGTPVLATMTVWQWLFDSQYGVVNWLLAEPLGLTGMRQHSWIIEPASFYLVATVIVVWMSVPFVVFTVYAGLLQVPEECMEAAQLDGANAWQRLRHLSLPMVKPVLLVVALLQVIWDLRVFTQIYVLQRAGAPTRETHLLGTYIYSLAKEFSMAGAMATIMLVITFVLTVFYIRRMLKEEV
ncbi:carbohydrate ABC transporter membrane protein 1, CUT1 family [Blastococcus sp. DSM 46786]|uniref:carbohydrate ABC transporter permease n=1 Tax=Blastococcus sp. DSM 46786 TaxID=1798227 RepID=UPI0008C84DFF|nr:sugar ABC transporter permease [Blastococcus sp. DSM 46786]SEL00117.1 carbohydrate ABC transporter membrane protein 1, CUT1 family [Blastococcus sp. DSM 46786]